MSLLFTLFFMWLGSAQPADLAAHIETAVLQEVADPVERWRPLVERTFPESETETALCIIRHESGGNPEADNPRSSARGLFQILGSLWAPKFGVERNHLYDAALNIRLAGDIWERQGWWAWSPYQRGACR